MDLSLIKQKCLVVAVWDRDTSNHDDFMAGVGPDIDTKLKQALTDLTRYLSDSNKFRALTMERFRSG